MHSDQSYNYKKAEPNTHAMISKNFAF